MLPIKLSTVVLSSVCLFLGTTNASAQTEMIRATTAIQNESNQLRQDLILTYRNSSLFGELIATNAKIKGAARRAAQQTENKTDWQSETRKLDQLVLELESLIEEANFQDGMAQSKTISRRLGNLITNIEALKPQQKTLIESSNVPAEISEEPGTLPDLLGTEFDPLAPLPTTQPTNSPSFEDALRAPIIMDGDSPVPTFDESFTPQPKSVLETSDRIDAPFPVEETPVLQVPNLTAPSPELTGFGDVDLLPLPGTDPQIQNLPQPTLQAPRPMLPTGTHYGSSNERLGSRLLSLPIQVEFFSFNPGGNFGYLPYGGFGGVGGHGGFQSHGGYRSYRPPYNGGGRYCPNGR